MLSVLLYSSECWKTTTTIEHKLGVFQTKCLGSILRIFWPNVISNQELLNRTGLKTITENIKIRRWTWLGHAYKMPANSIPRTALMWTPQGLRKRGRPKEIWRRTITKELKMQGLTLQTAARTAADRVKVV